MWGLVDADDARGSGAVLAPPGKPGKRGSRSAADVGPERVAAAENIEAERLRFGEHERDFHEVRRQVIGGIGFRLARVESVVPVAFLPAPFREPRPQLRQRFSQSRELRR